MAKVTLYENKFIVFIINSWSKVKEDTSVMLNLVAFWNSLEGLKLEDRKFWKINLTNSRKTWSNKEWGYMAKASDNYNLKLYFH